MRIAISHREGSFSDRWIEFCREKGVDFELVDCTASHIVEQLGEFDALLWHPWHLRLDDTLMARSLIMALEAAGRLVYPNTATFWHFDDKLAQKYLLEALGAPLVPTYAFLTLDAALDWIDSTSFPKVFKLRRGAGSTNVRLARTAGEARSLVRKAFGRGFQPVASSFADMGVKLRRHRKAGDVVAVAKRLPRTLLNSYRAKRDAARERGYAYFQDFLPGNTYDTRITIIGERAFAFTRNVRKNDFRASGSGEIEYDRDRVEPQAIRIAFDLAAKLGSQSMAFDFLKDAEGSSKVCEISFGFAAKPVHDCGGWQDHDLNWHAGSVWPQDAILEDVLAQTGLAGTEGDVSSPVRGKDLVR